MVPVGEMMKRFGVSAVLVGLMVAGCSRFREEPGGLGALTPQMARTGGEFGGPGTGAGEEVSPVRPVPAEAGVSPPSLPREAPKDTSARPGRERDYQARLGEVSLPVPSAQAPILDGEEGGEARLVNAVLAEVNDEVITREDILGPLRPQMEKWRKEMSPEEFRSQCRQVVNLKLREAISERLVVQEAKQRMSETQREELETTLSQILKDRAAEAGSMLLLEEQLKREGLSVEEAMEKERERLLVQRFLRERIAPTIHVTHSELLTYYRQVCAERYVRPTRVRLRLITIQKSEFPEAAQARALAEAVRERAAAGEDFAKLAERYSHDVMAKKGGDWGYVAEGSFRVQAVNEVLFALGKGEIGPLVETGEAYYIVKADDREEGRTLPFTEVQDELEDEIHDKKYNETVSEYIQDLYARSYVRVMQENF